jgi:glycosyltransferase involved in cell wall biosynthesis
LAYKKFERYEIWLCGQFDRCLVVTSDDQQILMRMLGSNMEHIRVTPNGVDTSIYRPDEAYPVPNTLVYNGALTYIANYDAMNFFIGDILPQVVSQVPGVRLKITGKTEGVEVDHLLKNGNVELTGYLDDIRPTVAESWACVVPLRMGGGTRLKILEAMALGTPVISTTKGAEGLDVVPGEHILVADEPQDFASATLQLLGDPGMRAKLARSAAKYVKERYDWYPIGQEFRVTVEELVK